MLNSQQHDWQISTLNKPILYSLLHKCTTLQQIDNKTVLAEAIGYDACLSNECKDVMVALIDSSDRDARGRRQQHDYNNDFFGDYL